MIARDYYLLRQAADLLNSTEEELIYLGAKGKLPIYILAAKYFIRYKHIDSIGGRIGCDGFENKKFAKLSTYSLQELEAGEKQASAIIEPEPFYDLESGEKNGRLIFELRHKNILYPEPITFDNYLQYPAPVQLKDCVLVVLHDDLRGLQEILTTPPEQAETENPYDGWEDMSINEKRNTVAKKWMNEVKPNIDTISSTQILRELEALSPEKGLFTKGGSDWLNRDHSVIPKRKKGKKPASKAV